MMRILRPLLLLAWLLPQPVLAQSVEDQVVSQLSEQGFTEFEVSRTLLGRLRVVAHASNMRRELVLNPATGSVLRDVITRRNANGVTVIVPDRSEEGAARASGNDTEANEDREEAREERQDAREERQEDREEAREERQEEREEAREERQEEREEAREERREEREDRREDRQDTRDERSDDDDDDE